MAIPENPLLRTERHFLDEYGVTMAELNRLAEMVMREPIPPAPVAPPLDISGGLSEEEIIKLAEAGIIL